MGFKTVIASGEGIALEVGRYVPEGTTKVFIVSDKTVMGLHGPAIIEALRDHDVESITIPAGEASKDLYTVAKLYAHMAQKGCDRSAAVLALGGGVVSDIAGFLAATMLRGLALIIVPTTVVGAVDAAIGGKNGVDIEAGKNLVGTFHWPLAVLIDPSLLKTLPIEQWRMGLAEVLKYGVIARPDLLDEVERAATALQAGRRPDGGFLFEAALVKAKVVEQDPIEMGLRRILNFGHTVGHAIEAATGFKVPHGEAVATGMAVEARVAERVCDFAHTDRIKIEGLVRGLGFETRPPCAFAQALSFMRRDKKALSGVIRMSLPKALGVMEEAGGAFAVEVDGKVLEGCWDG